ncbi:hypothetical protein JZ751_024833, partial [Albula glossodonta]
MFCFRPCVLFFPSLPRDCPESLSDNASAFSSRAKHLHRRMWWRDMKMKAIIALVVVILLLIIISECLGQHTISCSTTLQQRYMAASLPPLSHDASRGGWGLGPAAEDCPATLC